MSDTHVEAAARAVRALRDAPEDVRVAAYNRLTRELRAMVSDVCDDPVLAVQLLPADRVRANAYNPNAVAAPEMDLLELSIREDGVTMPVVTVEDARAGEWEVVDGFHRRKVITERLGRRYVPASVIDRPLADRMAATVRHNRARGKHQVDLMGSLVRALMAEGWADERIAEHLGMSVEELLRLKQIVGAARLLAGNEYSRSWEPIDR
ncbi:MAG TPA: ParB/RepB/Spo0J family partition protein [Longimicrobiales bacterium]